MSAHLPGSPLEQLVGPQPFKDEDVLACWQHYLGYFVDVLNGEYSLEEARADLRSLIGGKYDLRGLQPNKY